MTLTAHDKRMIAAMGKWAERVGTKPKKKRWPKKKVVKKPKRLL